MIESSARSQERCQVGEVLDSSRVERNARGPSFWEERSVKGRTFSVTHVRSVNLDTGSRHGDEPREVYIPVGIPLILRLHSDETLLEPMSQSLGSIFGLLGSRCKTTAALHGPNQLRLVIQVATGHHCLRNVLIDPSLKTLGTSSSPVLLHLPTCVNYQQLSGWRRILCHYPCFHLCRSDRR